MKIVLGYKHIQRYETLFQQKDSGGVSGSGGGKWVTLPLGRSM